MYIPRRNVYQAAIEAQKATIADLCQDLASHPDALMRIRASSLLAQIGKASVVEPLMAALQDECELVRLAAHVALEQIGDSRYVCSFSD